MKTYKGFLIGIPLFILIIWFGMARTWYDFVIFFLTLYGIIVTLMLHSCRKKMREARKICDPYMVKDLQTKYTALEDAHLKLRSEYGSLKGKSEHDDEVIGFFKKKFSTSDGAKVDELNGRFVSIDGLSRDDKDHLAYQWSEEGMSVPDIADKLNLSQSSVPAYISRGSKSVFRVNGREVKYELTEDGHVDWHSVDEDEEE